jgi:GNAT superfamily N-acetyltransferase
MSQEKVESFEARVATRADLEGVTETLAAAFAKDPVWSWAFPESEKLAVWWRFYVNSALRYPCTWMLDGYAAVSMWIPPGGVELTEDEEAEKLEPLIESLAGSRSAEIIELLERFDASRPEGPPHYYLSLLGVHPDHRGKGIGMGLLGENLRGIDAEGAPAYLESSNFANDHRYERLGFRKVDEFSTPDDSVTVATMWREPLALEAAGLRE